MGVQEPSFKSIWNESHRRPQCNKMCNNQVLTVYPKTNLKEKMLFILEIFKNFQKEIKAVDL